MAIMRDERVTQNEAETNPTTGPTPPVDQAPQPDSREAAESREQPPTTDASKA